MLSFFSFTEMSVALISLAPPWGYVIIIMMVMMIVVVVVVVSCTSYIPASTSMDIILIIIMGTIYYGTHIIFHMLLAIFFLLHFLYLKI